ncbi:MAG: GntR family transcriptional regulator [Chloroflexota bacterium]
MIDWETQPVRDCALRHSVREHVLDVLRSGRLTQGDRVPETSLARALDVSLSPVREALFRLADQGILEHRPRRGFYVRTLSEAETRETYTFRALLESFAARLVAQRRTTADGETRARDEAAFDALAAVIEEGGRAAFAGDRRAVSEANAKFHDLLVRTTSHSLLERAWALHAPVEWLLGPTWTWWHEPLTPAEARDWVARHERLLDLVRAGDAGAAEREASVHVREAGEGYLRRRFPDHVTHSTREGSSER